MLYVTARMGDLPQNTLRIRNWLFTLRNVAGEPALIAEQFDKKQQLQGRHVVKIHKGELHQPHTGSFSLWNEYGRDKEADFSDFTESEIAQLATFSGIWISKSRRS